MWIGSSHLSNLVISHNIHGIILWYTMDDIKFVSSFKVSEKKCLLVGIIPDMSKEPPTNTFLESLGEELDVAWNDGFMLKSLLTQREECFHIALLCVVACNIPASRKLRHLLGFPVLCIKACEKSWCDKSIFSFMLVCFDNFTSMHQNCLCWAIAKHIKQTRVYHSKKSA